MKVIQAAGLSVFHSFFAEILLVGFNLFQTLDFFAAFATTSSLLYLNTIWSFVFVLFLGGGKRTSIKVFVAPFFSSIFTVVTLWLIGSSAIDFFVLYLLLVVSGIIAVLFGYFYVRSFK